MTAAGERLILDAGRPLDAPREAIVQCRGRSGRRKQPRGTRLREERGALGTAELLGAMSQSQSAVEAVTNVSALGDYYERAFDLLSSDVTRRAFDLSQEPAELRSQYGRNTFGQSCLLARRLVEHGVKLVQVNMGNGLFGDYGWDTHSNNRNKISEICRDLDPALATLLGELKSSGLLSQTLFVLTSEFGRTPEVGGKDGRDHYPKIFTGLIGGGPVAGGMVLGETDAKGEKAVKESWHQKQFLATMYRAAGIDCEAQLMTPSGRPFPLSPRETKLISQLL